MNSKEETFDSLGAALAALTKRFGPYSKSWDYLDASGRLVGVVVRWDSKDGKTIRPVSRTADGRWRIGAMPESRPLYRLPVILAAPEGAFVFVVEGEKCADAVTSLGFYATTSAGGANAADKTDWNPLRGKHVVIVPDNDSAGERYADEVARLCRKVGAASIRVLRLADYATGLPVGGDIADVVESSDWCGLPLGDAAEVGDFAKWLLDTAKKIEPLRSSTILDDEANAVDDWAFQPFPVDALPEPVRTFVVDGAQAIGCDPSYLGLPLLTALASAIGNTRRLELKRGWRVPPILWTAIVGESGTSKTPALQAALRPVYERQQKALKWYRESLERYQIDLARWERNGALEEEKPKEPHAERLVVNDTTVEALALLLAKNPRGILLARDELGGWIGSFDRYVGKGKTSADEACWLSMFHAGSITVDRKTGSQRTIHVSQAAVSVVGGIQPGILRRALGREHRESGLAARLLLSYPPRQPKRWTETEIGAHIEAELLQIFDRLYELKPADIDGYEFVPVIVRLDDNAKSVWTEYYDSHAAEQAELTGDLAAAWSKLEEYAARFALVIHFVRWAAGDVLDETRLDEESMRAGIALVNWCKREAKRVYAVLDESPHDLSRLIGWLKDRGEVTVRDVQRGYWPLRRAGAAEEALERLVRLGIGEWKEIATSAVGGRPTRKFVVRSSGVDDT